MDEKNLEKTSTYDSLLNLFTAKIVLTIKKNLKEQRIDQSTIPLWKVKQQKLLKIYTYYVNYSQANDSGLNVDIKNLRLKMLNFEKEYKLVKERLEANPEKVGREIYQNTTLLSPLWLRDPRILEFVEPKINGKIELNHFEREFGIHVFYNHIGNKKIAIDRDDPDHDFKCYTVAMKHLYNAVKLLNELERSFIYNFEYKACEKRFNEALHAYLVEDTPENEVTYDKACEEINSLFESLLDKAYKEAFEYDDTETLKEDGFKDAYDMKIIEYRPGYYQIVHTPDNFRQTFVSYGKVRVPRVKTQEEIEIARTKYARTAAMKIREIGLSNIWTQFWTLTFDKNKVKSRYDYDYLSKLVRKWLKNLVARHNRKFGKKFEYVIVSEFHKDKAIHFHALVKNYEYELGALESHYSKRDKKSYKARTVNEWQYGFSTCMEITQDVKGENSRNVSLYISKYMAKSLENNPIGFVENKNMYWCSQGLKRPNKYYLDSRTISPDIIDSLNNDIEPEMFKYFDEDGNVLERDYLTKRAWDGVQINEDGDVEDVYREIQTKIYNLLIEPEQSKDSKDL